MNENDKNFKLLSIQKSKPENLFCFDCGSPNATWGSVNNGIFLCLNCAGIHRSLGVQISYIKSLSMDDWDNNQINLMKISGNERLKKFFEEYLINDDFNIERKYKLIATDYYRKMLHSEIYGDKLLIKKPNLEEGLKEINLIKSQNDIDKINNDNFICNNYIIKDNKKENKKKSFFNVFGLFGKRVKEKTEEIYKKAVGLQKKKQSNIIVKNNNNTLEPSFSFFGNNQITTGENNND